MQRTTLFGISMAALGIVMMVGGRLAGDVASASPQDQLTQLQQSLPQPPPKDVRAKDAAAEKLIASARQTMLQKELELSSRCQESLRKANRDELDTVSLNCYKGSLSAELEWLRTVRQQQRAMAPTQAVTAVTSATQNLMDAESAISDGIDTGVFRTADDAEASKAQLLAKYRDPFWQTWNAADAERLLWAMHDVTDELAALPAVELPADGVTCLQQSAADLQGVSKETDTDGSNTALGTAQQSLSDCLSLLTPQTAASSSGSGTIK